MSDRPRLCIFCGEKPILESDRRIRNYKCRPCQWKRLSPQSRAVIRECSRYYQNSRNRKNRIREGAV